MRTNARNANEDTRMSETNPRNELRDEIARSFDELEKGSEEPRVERLPSGDGLKAEIKSTWAGFDRDRAIAAREAPETARLRRQDEVTRVRHGMPLKEFIDRTREVDTEIRRNPEARAAYVRQQSDPAFLAADAQRRHQAVGKIYDSYAKAARIPPGVELRLLHHLANGAANPSDITGSIRLAHALALKELRPDTRRGR
jgi:hypothetical protein